jgi:PilZ domain
MTSINLPVTSDIILRFETEILHEVIQLNGTIVWKDNNRDHFQYGLQFILSEIEQNRIIKLMNQLELKMRSNPLPPGCKFHLENKVAFIQSQS